MKRYCLALDLVNETDLMDEYVKYHQSVWPEIKDSITSSGIVGMEIYKVENRLFMIMETEDDFSFERKSAMDAANAKVAEWEKLMWKFQLALPNSAPGEKWRLMEQIFDLNA